MIKFFTSLRCFFSGIFCYVKVDLNSKFNRRRILIGLKGFKGIKNYPIVIKKSILAGNFIVKEGCYILNSFFYSSSYGDFSIDRFTTIYNAEINTFNNYIEIGAFCSIASGVKMYSYGHNKCRITTYNIQKNILKSKCENEIIETSIKIEEDVWIGANSIILGNVHIGRGAIIAAGSVVTKSIPPYSIVAGCPAIVINMRFDDEIVKKIEESKWWTWDVDEIKRNEKLFKENISIDSFKLIK